MIKIALVECWLGPFPPWHDFYLKTCSLNPDVDWIVLHDAPPPARRPPNVRFLPITLAQLNQKATSLFGVELNLAAGVKLTDLRPAFGSLFSDFLSSYDYWGYNDSDVIWGQIRRFITDDFLQRHDVITACRTSIVGQFTLFRNAGITREPYRLIEEYVSLLAKPAMQHLDEDHLDEALGKTSISVHRRQLQVHDTSSISSDWEERAKAMELAQKGNLDDWFWEAGSCEWRNGRIFHRATGVETMFMHFQTWKKKWRTEHRSLRHSYWDSMFDGFIVSEYGITPHFKHLNPILSVIYQIWHLSISKVFHLLHLRRILSADISRNRNLRRQKK